MSKSKKSGKNLEKFVKKSCFFLTNSSEIDVSFHSLTASVDSGAGILSAVGFLQSFDEQAPAHIAAQIIRRDPTKKMGFSGTLLIQ